LPYHRKIIHDTRLGDITGMTASTVKVYAVSAARIVPGHSPRDVSQVQESKNYFAPMLFNGHEMQCMRIFADARNIENPLGAR
jgi:hypothetical protein